MIDSLPSDISQDIFLRLPIKCLIRCTAVRKSWRSMIKNPNLINTHLRRSTQLFSLLHCSTGKVDIHSLHYDTPAFDEYCKIEVPNLRFSIFPQFWKDWNDRFFVIGTCNGLVCLSYDFNSNFIICNPIIRKLVTLPIPTLYFPRGYTSSTGFAFDAVTNSYKVVRFVSFLSKTLVEVYSLATGCWSYPRSVAPLCTLPALNSLKCQAFVNGALHLDAIRSKDSTFFILAFDVASESCSEMMVPEVIERDNTLILKVSVSGDGKSIALFTSRDPLFKNSFLDIWEMEEYGILESWTKLIRLLPQWGELGRIELPSALCFRKSSELLVSKIHNYGNKELFSLELASKQFKSLGLCGFQYHSANSYEMSLILLDMDSAVSY